MPGLRPWTLRTRLLLSLLGLAEVSLVAFGVGSLVLLGKSLVNRVDVQLGQNAQRVSTPDRPRPRTVSPGTDPRLPTDFRVYFYSPAGTLQSRLGSPADEVSMPVLPRMDLDAVRRHGPAPFTAADVTGHGSWRVMVVVQAPNGPQPAGGTAAVVSSLASTRTTVNGLAATELVSGAILLVLLGATTMGVVRAGLRPLTKIEQTAQAIAAGALDSRVPDTDQRTETGRLGSALNVMMSRMSSALVEREQSERRLRRFVADASHELRTPLTSIRGFAELYRSGGAAAPADVDRLMLRIESESIRMGLLVDDLLLLARLDQERTLDFTEVDLLVIAADAVHDAGAAAPERSISLSKPHEPVRVIGDEHRLRQVVLNLVANAVTHTPPGTPVRVSVRQEPAGPHPDVVAAAGGDLPPLARFAVLTVTDEGPGIPVDQSGSVFDRFYRTDQARSRARGGSGLGLAITAAILEAHSGRIELSTAPGRGCTFRVLLAPA